MARTTSISDKKTERRLTGWLSSVTRYREYFPRWWKPVPAAGSGAASLWQSFFVGAEGSRRGAVARIGSSASGLGGLRYSEVLALEPLESRQLLSANQYWVNDNWVVTTDADSSTTLTSGDTVANSGAGDDGSVTGKVYGTSAFSTITAALAVAVDGDTIHVVHGNYAEALPDITQDVHVLAYNPGVNLDATGATTGIKITGTADAEISGISLSNFSSEGIQIVGKLNLSTSIVDGGLTGVFVNGGDLTMSGTKVRNAGIFGVQVAGPTGHAAISTSEMTNDALAGVIVSTGSATITTSVLTGNSKGVLVNASGSASVTFSDLSGNSTRGVENATANAVNASGNWWGSVVEATVQSKTLGSVDFTPYLGSGSDTDGGAVGFGGDRSSVYVTAQGQQTGAVSRVQEGVDVVDATGTVHVLAGTYAISNGVSIGKAVTLEGAKHGVAGTDGLRGSGESILNGPPTQAVGAFTIGTTAPIVIDGFTFNGSKVLAGQPAGSDLSFKSNVLNLQAMASGSQTNMIFSNPKKLTYTDNLFTTTGFNPSNSAVIQVAGNYAGGMDATNYMDVTGNTFVGIGDFGTPNPGNGQSTLQLNFSGVQGNVQNNTFDGVDIGVIVANGSGNLTIDANTFKNITRGATEIASGSYGAGVLLFSPAFTNGPVTISNNTFQNSDSGIRGSAAGGTINTALVVTGNTFTGNVYHIVDKISGEMSLGATNSFNGVTLSSATTSDLFTIADKVVDTIDVASYGHVRLKAGNVYVTPNSFFTPGGTTTPSIQRGVDAASTDDIVHVQAGTYTENVTVNKRITLDGDGKGSNPSLNTVIVPAVASQPVIRVTASGQNSGNRLTISHLRTVGSTHSGLYIDDSVNAISSIKLDEVAAVDTTGGALGGLIVSYANHNMGDIVVSNSEFSGNINAGIQIADSTFQLSGLQLSDLYVHDNRGNGFITGLTNSFGVQDVQIQDSTFVGNGWQVGQNFGNVMFFKFVGNAVIDNVDIDSDGISGHTGTYGLQFYGGAVTNVSNTGNSISLNDVDIDGAFRKVALLFQNYLNVAGFSLTDVDVTGASASTPGWATLAVGHVDPVNSFNLGNTKTTDLHVWDTDGHAGQTGNVNALNTDFYTPGHVLLNKAVTDDNYAIEDVVRHSVDVGTAFLGTARWNAGHTYVTPASFLSPVTTTPSIQRAVDAATSGDVVHVKAGTYTGDVSTSGKIISLSPGSSPGQVTLNGNLSLDSNDFLVLEINGTSPTTGYDNLIVNGTVALGGATLSATRGYNPVLGATFTIVTNDNADAVSGIFNGLPEGSVVDLDNVPFTISYVGGSGNDITLSVLNPNEVWVNDTWIVTNDIGPAGLSFGDEVMSDTGAGDTAVSGKVFGYDAYGSNSDPIQVGYETIQSAIGFVATSGIVHVLAGTYHEDVNVNKTISLLGQGISGTDKTTVSGAIGGVGPVKDSTFGITASNVLLEGFYITRDGNNPAQWNLDLNLGGVTIQGLGISGVEIRNNQFEGNRTGIDLNKTGGHWIHNNIIDNNRTGMILRNAVTNTIVEQNSISDNWTVGVLWLVGGEGEVATGTHITNNRIAGNWDAQIENRSTSGGVKDFSGNWLGTATPTALNTSTSNASYASLIPVSLGGTYVQPPAPLYTVRGIGLADMDFTPYLASGTDTNVSTGLGTTGFQGDFSHLIVTTLGGQSGATGRIQEGINRLANGSLTGANRVVDVTAGTYVEQVDVNKPMKLLGAQAGVDARSRAAAESIIVPDVTGADPSTAPYPTLVYISSSDVTVDGLTLDGDNPALSGTNFGGANIDAEEGIGAYDGVGGLTIQNNIIRNMSYAGMDLYNFNNGGAATSNNLIKHNLIDNLGGFAWGIGILIYNDFYASIEENKITNVLLGVQTGNFDNANPGATGGITSNEISARRAGIWNNLAYGSASSLAITGNTITALDDASLLRFSGIWLTSLAAAAPTLSGNVINAGGSITQLTVGYDLWNDTLAGGVTISGGSVTGADYGVWANNYDGYPTSTGSDGGSTVATVSGVLITGSSLAGVFVKDNALNTNGATVHVNVTNDTNITASGTGVLVQGADASATIQDNDNSIHGNTIGIDVNGGSADVTNNHIYDNGTGIRFINGGHGSVTNNNFAGPDDNDTDLMIASDAGAVTIGANNQFRGDTFYIDNQSTQSYDLSSNGTTFDEVNNFRIEDKMHHRLDTDLLVGNGLITWVADNVYVTNAGFDHSIQRGIDSASVDDTVNVEAGTYAESVQLNKKVTLLGAGSGPAGTVIQPTGTWGINVQASGVSSSDRAIIRDLRIAGTGSTSGLYFNSAVSHVLLDNVASVGNDMGLNVAGSGAVTDLEMDDVSLAGNIYGMRVSTTGSVTHLILEDGHIDSNIYGLYTDANSGSSSNQAGFTDISVSGTSFDDNLTKGIYLEKADHITFDGISVDSSGTGGSNPAGIDLNLKFGTFTEIALQNFSVTNSGNGGSSTAVTIKGRGSAGDAPYSSNPATVTGVHLTNLTIDDSIPATSIGADDGSTDLSFGNRVTGITMSGVHLLGDGGGLLYYVDIADTLDVGDTEFAGTLQAYIGNASLSKNLIDATNGATFGGFNAGAGSAPADLADYYATEDKVFDNIDVGSVGLVRLLDENIFVTINSFIPFFGTNAASIQRGVDAADSGDTVWVQAGTYVEQVEIDKPLTVFGAQAGQDARSRSGPETIVVPDVQGADTSTAPYPVLMYVSANNVTIDGFTLDGDNTDLTDGIDFGGANIDAEEGIGAYDGVGSLTIVNNVIRNFSYAGMDLYNYYNSGAPTSDNLIKHNLLDNLGGDGWGIGMLLYNDFYASVEENTITDALIGVQTGNFDNANPGAAGRIIDNNISATRAGIWNNLVYGAASPFTITGNTITALDDPTLLRFSGIWLTSLATAAPTLSGNIINATGSITQLTVGYDLWNDTVAGGVTISGGSVTGADYGVWANNYDGYPTSTGSNGGSTTATVSGVSISGSSLAGVFVKDNASSTNGATVHVNVTNDTNITASGTGVLVQGADASATIEDNDASIHGNTIGIDVDGGSADITNNHIYANGTGIRVRNSGSATIEDNDFGTGASNTIDVDVDGGTAMLQNNVFAATTIGLLIQGGGIVDAGQSGRPVSNDITGLGISSGGNDFTSYTTAATNASGAIVNLNTNGANANSGKQVDPLDTTAFGNLFNVTLTTAAQIDTVIWHDADDSGLGFVEFGTLTPLSVDLDVTSIDENGTVTLSGSFSDAPQDFTLTINWGDGPAQVIHLFAVTDINSGGVTWNALTQEFTVEHTYLDDESGMQDDEYPISATVQEGWMPANGALTSDTTSVDVANVNPVFTGVTGGATINENGSVTINGTFTDVGTLDTHTVMINFGNGVTLPASVTESLGSGSFTLTYTYPDDVGAGPSNTYPVTVTLTDDDTGSAVDTSQSVTVNNVNPVFTGVTGGATINENGSVTISGTFTDAGPDDTHTVMINFGNGVTLPASVSESLGSGSFTLTYTYPDDVGAGPSNTYPITITLTDDDTGSAVDTSQSVTVNNVNPVFTGVTGGATINENGSVTISGTFTDVGTQDTHTVMINFGNGVTLPAAVSESLGSGSFTLTYTYPDDVGAGPSNTYPVTVTLTDDDTGSAVDTSQSVTVNNVNPVFTGVTGGATINENGSVTISGTFTDAGPDDTHTVMINFGNGVTLPASVTESLGSGSFTLTYTYPDDVGPGPSNTYPVTITLTDDDTGSVVDTSQSVTVNNVDPVFTGVTGGATINENGSVTISGTFTDASPDDTHTVTINFGNGVTLPASVTESLGSGSFTLTYTYPDDVGAGPSNTYPVTVTLTDDDTGSVVDTSQSVTVSNVDPVFTGVTGGATINENGSVTISGTFTDASPDDIHTVTINFGNGVTLPASVTESLGSGSFTLTYTYPDDVGAGPSNTYPVTVTLTDDDTGSAVDTSQSVTVNNVNPVFTGVTGGATINENGSVTISGTFTDAGPDDTHTVMINFGNGVTLPASVSESLGSGSFTLTYTYPDDVGAGPSNTYPITITLTDDDTGSAVDTSQSVTVNNVNPVFTGVTGGATINENGSVTISGTFTDVGTQDTHTVMINFGNGVTLPAAVSESLGSGSFTLTYTYPDDVGAGPSNTYPVTITLTDDDTGSAVDTSQSVTVNNVNPVFTGVTGGATINENGSVTISGTFTDAGPDDTHTVMINFGNGVTLPASVTESLGSGSFTLTYTYPDDVGAGPSNTYPVTITLTDDDTGSAVDTSQSVTVNNVDPVFTGVTGGATINENGSVTISGTFTDASPDDTHTVMINFGNGVTLPASVTESLGSGSFTLTYTYPDDVGAGPSNTYPVTITLTDDDTGSAVDTSQSVTVNNVNPVFTGVTGGATINENGSVTISGTFTDVGTQDTHTVTINFGNGVTLPASVTESLGSGSFTLTYTYPDDVGAGPSNTYPVTITLTDDDTGSAVDTSQSVTVNNVNPVFTGVTGGATINENGSVTISGTFTDVGTQDTHTVMINFGNGVTLPASVTESLGSGSFTLTYTYPDDVGAGPSNTYPVTITLTDDDTGSAVDTSQSVTVNNVNPVFTGVTGGATINENGSVTISGTFTDVGTQDTHTVMINLGNGVTLPASVTESLGSGSFTLTYQYLDDSPTITPSDTYTITITLTDDDTGSAVNTSQSVTVNNVAPFAAAIVGAPGSSPEGTPITVNASFSDPGTLDTYTYTWIVLKNGSPYFTQINAMSVMTFTPNDNGNYQITLGITDDDSGSTNALPAFVTVTNVAPTIDLVGGVSTNEGSSYILLLSTIHDPGADTVTSWVVHWGDGATDVYSSGGSKSHLYDDNALVTAPITVDLVDEDGLHLNAGMKNRTVNNVAPTAILINGGSVNEGSTGFVQLISQADVSNNDTTASFRYAFDFDNNGTFEIGNGTYAGSSTTPSATVPASFLADGAAIRTVKGRIIDKDGGFTDYTTDITVNNVAPVVNAGADDMAFSGVSFSHPVTFTDPGTDSPWTVRVDWNGDTVFDETFNVTSHNFNVVHTYGPANIGFTYGVVVEVNDNDGGVNTDTFNVQVVANTFRVSSFQTNPSGFTATFNRAADLTDLNLYDSLLDGSSMTFDPADVTLVQTGVGPVSGSMVWNAATNTLTFVKTGDVLATGNYSVTLVSGANAFNDTSNEVLDGDGDFTAGGDYTNTFSVTSGPRVVGLRDFARGPGQSVQDDPTSVSSKLAVSIDFGALVTAVDFEVNYDPALLTISGASLATGLPPGWTITSNPISAGVLKVTVSGFTALSGTNVPVVFLTASVPNSAPYGEAEAIRLLNVKVNGGDIASKGDYAIHKNAYLGDADGDGIYLAFDAALISRMAVSLDKGFDAHDWTDPLIVADAHHNNAIDGQDSSYVLQKFVGLSRPEIPNIPPGVVLVASVSGADPQLSIPANYHITRNSNVSVPVNIDIPDGETVISSSFDVTYDTNVMSFTSATNGTFWTAEAGWSILAFESSPGVIRVGMINSTPSATGNGAIANLNFHVLSSADNGSSPVTVTPVSAHEGGLTWTKVDGNVIVDPTSLPSAPKLFYNQSKFDGNNSVVNAADDAAIATDKTPYIAGAGAATFANVSGYSKGINGIMIDLAGLPGPLTTDDFKFKVGNNNTPSLWNDAPMLPSITIRSMGGFDRVELVWPNNAIQKTWLEVMIKANDNTGLAQGVNVPSGYGYAFFFGNAPGDTGVGDTATFALVNATDELEARNHQLLAGATVTNIYDFDHSGSVNATDQLVARNNGTIAGNALRYLNFSAGALAPEAEPLATPAASVDSGVEWVGLSVPSAMPAATNGLSWSNASLPAASPVAAAARFFELFAGEQESKDASDDDSSSGYELDDDLLDELAAAGGR